MVLPKPLARNAQHLNIYTNHPPLSPTSVTSSNGGNDDAENVDLLRFGLPMLNPSPQSSPSSRKHGSSFSTCSPYSIIYTRTRFLSATIAMLLCIGVSTQSVWQLSRWTTAAAEQSSTYIVYTNDQLSHRENVTDDLTFPVLIPIPSNRSAMSNWHLPETTELPQKQQRAPTRKIWKRQQQRQREEESHKRLPPPKFGYHPRLLQVPCDDLFYGDATRELHQRRARFSSLFRRRRRGDAFVSYYYNATAEEINIDYPETVYRSFESDFYEQCEAIVTCEEGSDVQIRPACNVMHELALEENTDVSLLSMAGSWRSVWKVDEIAVDVQTRRSENQTTTVVESVNNTLILKLLMLHREFDTESFHSHAVDAITMERLTASPYVVSGYGFCGQTVLTEYAPHTTRDALQDSDISLLTRLRIARDLARGLADLHAYRRLDFDDRNETSTTQPPPALFAHHDINIANTIQVVRDEDNLGPPPPNMTSDERRRRAQYVHVQWNDFNLGIWTRQRKPTASEDVNCDVPVRYEGPLWRSPEEIRNTTLIQADACDVFSMGNLMFQILHKRQPWTHLEVRRYSLEEIAEFKMNGTLPTISSEKFLPPDGRDHDRLEVRVLLAAMRATFRDDPAARPSAWQLARGLGTAHEWVKVLTKKTPRRSDEEIAELFAVG